MDHIKNQEIIRVTNLVTLEGALFNRLRAARPVEGKPPARSWKRSSGPKAAHLPSGQQTPADTFGRVRGRYCLTASNIAKYDCHHAVIIFDEHNPWRFQRRCGRCVYYRPPVGGSGAEQDPAAKYFFFLWNCLWKSGASIIHGHAQAT